MDRFKNLPIFVVLMGISALAMLVPALHAIGVRDWGSARAFFFSAALVGVVATLFGFATAHHHVRNAARAHLLTLVAAFALLPLLLAVPLYEAVRTTSFLNAWFEMVSSVTTTGATLFVPERLPDSVHLWRALVGWLGGFFMWVTAIALLAPMNLGGFEVISGAAVGAGARVAANKGQRAAEETRELLLRHAGALAPVYFGLTGVLWIGLLIAGARPFVAACHAMSVLATSGISPLGGLDQGNSGAGMIGEAMIVVFLVFAISRTTFEARRNRIESRGLSSDYEMRLAAFLLVLVTSLLFLRHWVGAFEVDVISDLFSALRALWGSAFTTLSFLTTAGFVSAEWETARAWSGLATPGMVLMGLAVFGGGVATTAGGVKLLRVYALYKHGARELDRLVFPASVGGAGPLARRIRGKGAYVSWVFFMLFALSIAIFASLLAATGAPFENAMILAVAALTNCGPVAEVVLSEPLAFADLGSAGKLMIAGAMVIGRLEALAIVALFNPAFWRP